MNNKRDTKMKLMTHVVVGYPSLEKTIEIVKAMVEAGADIVELQIPFSDPLADGPTIMRACESALKNGTRVSDAFTVAKQLSKEITVPLYFMAYYNTVFRYGVEKFCKDAKFAECTGLIIPDMPLDEEPEEHLFLQCKKQQLENIRVVSPASTEDRLEKNAKIGTGFVYATARQGITGAKESLGRDVSAFLERVKKQFSIPLAVGFGISKPEHIKALQGSADISVVGSAIIDVINNSRKDDMIENVKEFINLLKSPYDYH